MPENTMSVARPTKWGNPWTIAGAIDAGYPPQGAQAMCVNLYREWMRGDRDNVTRLLNGDRDKRRNALASALPELQGKNLACWCPLDQPCHADVLLELAEASLP